MLINAGQLVRLELHGQRVGLTPARRLAPVHVDLYVLCKIRGCHIFGEAKQDWAPVDAQLGACL
eukprot:11773501-Prorocentrum_lima.AAC.1